ncbi:alcohol dehydrogenase catalytic domain-containing protein [Actinomadura meyerae]|uniref:alcohol dehydrogenase catalytic domain-containing protein n=1 Tax=Actinomadura meyerae TaxID=240840 RepID=UPI003CCC3828
MVTVTAGALRRNGRAAQERTGRGRTEPDIGPAPTYLVLPTSASHALCRQDLGLHCGLSVSGPYPLEGRPLAIHAVQIDRHGGPEVLLIVRKNRRTRPPDGEVFIRTTASSLNPVDCQTRAWEVGPLPATLGRDLSGRIDASAAPAHHVGADRRRGTWSEYVALPSHLVTALPIAVPLAEAAALLLVGVTALQALRAAELASGERILAIGAAGVIGGVAAQRARRTGAHVDGLVFRPGHEAAARGLGTQQVWRRADDLPHEGHASSSIALALARSLPLPAADATSPSPTIPGSMCPAREELGVLGHDRPGLCGGVGCCSAPARA